ncbi:cofactor assembly of complex C subunit B [Thermosynechococcus sp. HN-54]|uniref:cofactor assembly of complex C subunit B n=1 Tax=Thermosynechococcus sp. HN-54 TaxID=2933959 RepID=UPI00202CBF44|nr:cofactor assembly of complex C subunit B [Thermosynechococcus sp. HN-54]URR35675.1 cofactor assembly of complex C subunit B [Thermosynechococcus sp. HN-54]
MSSDFIYPSTLLLTSLLAVGFVFFIRASTKERIETKEWLIAQPIAELAPRLKQYFQQRGYRLHSVSADGSEVTFQGNVAASPFVAALLLALAVSSATAIALVLTVLFPDRGILAFGLIGLTPIAPWFYWRGAQRLETVRLSLQPQSDITQVTLEGHRDELITFEDTLLRA